MCIRSSPHGLTTHSSRGQIAVDRLLMTIGFDASGPSEHDLVCSPSLLGFSRTAHFSSMLSGSSRVPRTGKRGLERHPLRALCV